MSLNADSADVKRVKILLRSADQFLLWKARCAAACWSVAKQNIFEATDDDCDTATEECKKDPKLPDWVGKCWLIITLALHDELFMKVAHVQHGHIASLFDEIRASLLVSSAEDIQPPRIELYSATMASNGNDLQTFISFLTSHRDSLAFLEVEIPDEELIAVFIKGLHPIFQPLQVHFAIPGTLPDSFSKIIEIARRFCISPAVHGELTKLKSAGVSQNIFYANADETPFCMKFTKTGSCTFGDRCKYLHGGISDQKQSPIDKVTHTFEVLILQQQRAYSGRLQKKGSTRS